jgi:hypothetical protein
MSKANIFTSIIFGDGGVNGHSIQFAGVNPHRINAGGCAITDKCCSMHQHAPHRSRAERELCTGVAAALWRARAHFATLFQDWGTLGVRRRPSTPARPASRSSARTSSR